MKAKTKAAGKTSRLGHRCR